MEQRSLFSWIPAEKDPSLPAGSDRAHQRRALNQAHRIALQGPDAPRASWLERVPLFFRQSESLYERLARGICWQVHEREMFDRVVQVPRLVGGLPTQEGDDGSFNWEGQSIRSTPSRCSRQERLSLRRDLMSLSRLLSQHYGKNLSSLSFAWYRDGNDSVAFHGDKMGALRGDTVVAVLSLGGLRRFLVRPTPEAAKWSAAPFGFTLSTGDLTVMGGAAQLDWQHAVPKQKCAEGRMAVMFREMT